MTRQCSECNLCCKLLPMKRNFDANFPKSRALFGVPGMVSDFDKPAGQPCPHQKFHHGCAIYAKRPLGCRVWSCRWLVEDDTADQRRPDRSHAVIDMTPDFIRLGQDGSMETIQVVQIWCDPRHPDAHREPAIRAYMRRRAAEGIATLVRFSERDAITVFAPELTGADWVEHHGGEVKKQSEIWPEGLRDQLPDGM